MKNKQPTARPEEPPSSGGVSKGARRTLCIKPPSSLPILRMPGWDRIPGLVHGFLGRHGGVSRGSFADLNLSSRVGDDPSAVADNWRRVTCRIGDTLRFATMRQVHGSDVGIVQRADAPPAEVDALASSASGVALSVLTADCVPMLFVAADARVVAVAHAGWRGTLAGITAHTVGCLDNAFNVAPATVSVALGPAIGGCCYEIDAEVVEQLEHRWGRLRGAVHTSAGAKPRLDLRSANAAILVSAGVDPRRIAMVGPCTRCAASEYFSHRAANGQPTGRQLSFIGWQS